MYVHSVRYSDRDRIAVGSLSFILLVVMVFHTERLCTLPFFFLVSGRAHLSGIHGWGCWWGFREFVRMFEEGFFGWMRDVVKEPGRR